MHDHIITFITMITFDNGEFRVVYNKEEVFADYSNQPVKANTITEVSNLNSPN